MIVEPGFRTVPLPPSPQPGAPAPAPEPFSGDPIESGGHDGGVPILRNPDTFLPGDERLAKAKLLLGSGAAPSASEQ